ncbi:MAG TPA: acyl-CoA dehydrogenase family protein [Candidatus Dormibacteraeota bacterium]|nr:acyl-CoA dehydrogenase family protein [Candidatus Dormibacteraeota bacterium]
MDLGYTADQEALRALARQVLEDHAAPARLAATEAAGDRVDRDLWAALARAGLLGTAIPEEHGGSGLGFFELAILLEEVGRAVAPVPAHPTLVMGTLPLAAFGSPEQRRRLLPGVAAGDVMLTAALAEPRNPDPLAPGTRAAERGGKWHLEGVKLAVPAAASSAAIVVPARPHGGGEDRAGVAELFLVAPGDAGVALARQESTTREVQHLVTLDGAPAERLAGPGALPWLVRRATAGLCAMQVGVTERALRMTAAYTSSREQFGRPLSAFQAVSQRAADAYVDVEAIRLTTLAAVCRLAEGDEDDEAVAIAKFWAAEAGQRVVHAAQHLHGGVGVDVSYPLHRYFLWAKQLELTLGGATEQLLRIGAGLAGDAGSPSRVGA